MPRGIWTLRIFCANKWPGLIEECERAMRALRPGGRVNTVRCEGCVAVTSYSKHWPCLFPQHGPGKKHTREIRLEAWQQEIVTRHPEPFLRGLFHSDGCRITNPITRRFAGKQRSYAYPRYLFVNRSVDILRLCGETLDRKGISWRYSKPTTISVARREAVAALDVFVGPKY